MEGKKTEAVITAPDGESRIYLIPYGSRLKVHTGDKIEAGQEITEGSINPNDILRIKGIDAVQQYLLSEVQKVYRLQGVHISDKHIELIIRQMLRKVKIENAGDTDLITGALTDIFEMEEKNNEALDMGLEPAQASRELLGITKASLATDSFLSAASFQETTRVLTDAAIKGKVDPLIGLKENVIIGQLVPAGTGVKAYSRVELDYDREDEDDEEEELIDDMIKDDITNVKELSDDMDIVMDDDNILAKAVQEERENLEKDDELAKAFDMFDMDFLDNSSSEASDMIIGDLDD